MTTAPVDVVIPLHNGAAFIEECIGSVLRQTLLPDRVIVVDDGSTDDGPAKVRGMAEQAPRTEIILLSQPNLGPNAARQHGVAHGHSPYVALLDSDDAWLPAKLERQWALAERTGAALIYCGYHLIDAKGMPLRGPRIVSPTLRGDVFRELLKENRVSGSASAVLLRREALADAGAFDQELRGSEDLDMWLRIARGHAIDFVADDLLAIRVHAEGAQTDHRLMLENMLRFYAKWIDEARVYPEVLHHWGHLIAEFALRIPDPRPVIAEVERIFSPADRAGLFVRAGGSLRRYLWLKRARAIFRG